jgi:hypothetical protein
MNADPLLLPVSDSGEVVLTDAVAEIDPAANARAVTVNVADLPLSSVPALQMIATVPLHPGDAE